MMEIYGRKDSSNCAKVFWLLDAMDLDFTMVPKGGHFGGNDDPAYKALNPHGKVPTLVEGDVVIWESHAILRYVAIRYGPTPMFPQDHAARARVDMWLDWVAITLNPVLGAVRRAYDEETLQAAMPAAAYAFTLLDAQLSKSDFIAGDTATLADIAAAPHLMRWLRLPHERPALGSLDAYYARLGQDDHFVRHIDQALDR